MTRQTLTLDEHGCLPLNAPAMEHLGVRVGDRLAVTIGDDGAILLRRAGPSDTTTVEVLETHPQPGPA